MGDFAKSPIIICDALSRVGYGNAIELYVEGPFSNLDPDSHLSLIFPY
jgi:hypothetical protein